MLPTNPKWVGVDKLKDEKEKETFLAKVGIGNRITIYEPVREFLNIEAGDIVRVIIQLERKGEGLDEDSQPETEPEEDIVEPLLEEEAEEPTVEPVVEIAAELEPELDEVEAEPEVAEKVEGQESCPHVLDFPLQDPDVCLEWKCEHYKRQYGDNPASCNWTGWIKIGEEVDLEDEDDKMILLLCESDEHKPGLIPHEKRDLGDGWAMYTCLSCKKSTPMVIEKAEG